MVIQKALRLFLAICLALYGCAGSSPNPVTHYTPGDEKRSCTSLKGEIASNEAQLIRLASEKDSTLGKNVILGVTGVLLIVPWFFMDVKGKEAGEIEALHHRNRTLRQFASDKGDCQVPEPKVKFEEAPKPSQPANYLSAAQSESPPFLRGPAPLLHDHAPGPHILRSTGRSPAGRGEGGGDGGGEFAYGKG